MSEKNQSMQGLRGLAFISIFLGHARIGTKGVWAVCTFCIMSGFLMTKRHDDYYGLSLKENVQNVWRQIRKLYPLHIVLMLASFVYFGINQVRILQLFMNVFLIQSWIPSPGAYFSLNGVSWYLSSTLFCYFMFPFLLRFLKVYKGKEIIPLLIDILLLFTLACLGTSIEKTGIFNILPWGLNDFPRWLSYISPFWNLALFFIGCCLGKLNLNLIKEDMESVMVPVLEIIGLILFVFNEYCYFTQTFLAGSKWFVYSFIFIPQSMIFVCLTYMKSGVLSKKIFSNSILVWLGNLSAYGYLIHWFVLVVMHRYIQRIYGDINKKWIIVTAIVAFIITMVASYSYSLFIAKAWRKR